MSFFKEKSYDIVRLFIYQVGIAIFSMFLYTAVISAVPEDKDGLKLLFLLLVSLFAVGFYFVLLYTTAWEWGAKQKIRIDAGKATKTPFEGALLSALSNVPNVFLSVLAIILIVIYMLNGAKPLLDAYGIVNLILRFLASMYLGIIRAFLSLFTLTDAEEYLYYAIGFLVMPIFSVVATHLGYTFGSFEKRIFPQIKKKNV